MTEDRRQQDFAQRLSRISKERGHSTEPERGGAKRDKADYDYNAARERHPIRNGIIWLILLGAMGAGGFYGWQALPPDLKNMVTTLIAPDAVAPAAGIAETEIMSDQGATLASPLVVQATSDPLNLANVATQVSLPSDNTSVGAIIPIVRNEQCNLRTPTASEKIMGVRLENALLPAPLYAFSNQQLAAQLLMNVEEVTQDGGIPSNDMTLSGAKGVLDVFVTDTTAPLYLVLQNLGPGVIWNLHTAPGVMLSHVALIGSDFSGAAHLQPDTTIEGLLVSDFVPPHQYGADDSPRDCMIRPWRSPQSEWIGSLKAEAGSLVDQNQLYSYAKGYEAYNRWYTGALGVDAAINTVTARDAAHVLIGPPPVEPITYRSLAGADLHLMETDHLFVGDAATRNAAAERMHQDLLTAAIGGDISALNPPAMERNSQ